MALWPSGFDFENLVTAWRDAQIGHYFLNTVKIAVGSWLVQLVVAVTGGYVLGILRPWYARILTGAVLVTLFVPPVVLLVPLFLTVLDLPIVGTSLLNSYWGDLAAGRGQRLQRHPRQAVHGEPAHRDHRGRAGRRRRADPPAAGRSSLPMSKPVIGVVSVFAVLFDVEGLPLAAGRAP